MTVSYLICGIVKIINSFAIMQMVIAYDSFVHTGITIYVYAIYAFYKIILATINFVKTLKTHEMTVRASKNINLADAMVSIFALQTAILKEFSGVADIGTKTANAVTGAIVCALTAAIGIFMIIYGCIHIRKIKREYNDISVQIKSE